MFSGATRLLPAPSPSTSHFPLPPPPIPRFSPSQSTQLSITHSSVVRCGGAGIGGSRPRRVLPPPKSRAVTKKRQGVLDPELRRVLELATDAELFELEDILFGPSYFSPLLKSITNKPDIDYVMVREDTEGRQDFIVHLESRFLFLAADAGSTLRGWRPSYRSVLLAVRRKLSIPCSSRLSTEDLEVEIFLQLLHDYSSSDRWDDVKYSSSDSSFEVGLDWWKVHGLVALRVGAKELQQTILKGGGMLALTNLYRLLARNLSKKMFLEAADYKIKHEILVRGGQLAAVNLESRAALLAARQGLAHAVSRSLGVRNLMMLLGPILWGTVLADIVIQSLGTDYTRILRAIYAFAQIRLYRTHGLKSNAVRTRSMKVANQG